MPCLPRSGEADGGIGINGQSDYARPMPALGFDPTRGADLTRSPAKQYCSVVTELQSPPPLVKGVDTSQWQGQAGDALRVMLGTVASAIQSTITPAQALQSAASSWAGQFTRFQSEADSLAKQAATAQASPPKKPPARAVGHPSPTAGPGADADPLDGLRAKAYELNCRYLAAAKKTTESVPEDPGLWEKTEPIRKVLEFVCPTFALFEEDVARAWLGLPDRRRGRALKTVTEGMVEGRLLAPNPPGPDGETYSMNPVLGLILAARYRPTWIAVTEIADAARRRTPRLFALGDREVPVRAVVVEEPAALPGGAPFPNARKLGPLGQLYRYVLVSEARAAEVMAEWAIAPPPEDPGHSYDEAGLTEVMRRLITRAAR